MGKELERSGESIGRAVPSSARPSPSFWAWLTDLVQCSVLYLLDPHHRLSRPLHLLLLVGVGPPLLTDQALGKLAAILAPLCLRLDGHIRTRPDASPSMIARRARPSCQRRLLSILPLDRGHGSRPS